MRLLGYNMTGLMSTETPSHFECAILRTLIFFDIFEYPLTDFEIWKFLISTERGEPYTVLMIRDCLASSPFLAARISSGEGLFYLVGRDLLRARRQGRMIYSYRKYIRAKRFVSLLAHIPFVRMVCVCNTLGLNVARDESDIDLFIVVSARHVWTVRFFCTSLAHILNLRPRKGHERDTFCLSFFISDCALDLSSLQLDGWDPDVYLASWVAWCVPLYDDGVYDQFFLKNAWITDILPNVFPCEPIPRRRITLSPIMHGIKHAGEIFSRCFGGAIERILRSLQLRILPIAIRNRANVGTGVVVSDTVLKFHIADRRQEISERFEQRCEELGIRNQKTPYS